MDNEDHAEDDEEERYAMMSQRDYDFNGLYDSDEGDT
jgi:hypothetical protein